MSNEASISARRKRIKDNVKKYKQQKDDISESSIKTIIDQWYKAGKVDESKLEDFARGVISELRKTVEAVNPTIAAHNRDVLGLTIEALKLTGKEYTIEQIHDEYHKMNIELTDNLLTFESIEEARVMSESFLAE